MNQSLLRSNEMSPAAADPVAVYALAAEGDVLWAGTSFGVCAPNGRGSRCSPSGI